MPAASLRMHMQYLPSSTTTLTTPGHRTLSVLDSLGAKMYSEYLEMHLSSVAADHRFKEANDGIFEVPEGGSSI